LLLFLAFLAHAVKAEQVLGAGDRFAQRSVRVIEPRRKVEREMPFVLGGLREAVGMQLPGKRVEALLERAQVQSQLSRQAEKREVVAARRERLDLSAGWAEMRAGCGGGAVPAICLCRNGCRWCAHKFNG
jgi:hypothetical protein